MTLDSHAYGSDNDDHPEPATSEIRGEEQAHVFAFPSALDTGSTKSVDAEEPLIRARVSGLGELITLVPYQLGYVPGTGVVTILVVNGRVEGTMRVPAPVHEGTREREAQHPSSTGEGGAAFGVPTLDWSALSERVWSTMRRSLSDHLARKLAHTPGEPAAFLVGYEELPGDAVGGLARMRVECALLGIEVLDEAVVRDNLWRQQGSPRWQALPKREDVAAVAAYVLRGQSPAPSRASIRQRLAEDPQRSAVIGAALDSLLEEMFDVDEQAQREITDEDEATGLPYAEDDPPSRRLVTERGVPAVQRWLSTPGAGLADQHPTDTAAGLLLLLQDEWRDTMYAALVPELFTHLLPLDSRLRFAEANRHRMAACVAGVATQELLSRLCAVARVSPEGMRADVCALLALTAWWHGDTVLTEAAAEESLKDYPRQSMAAMVLACLDHGVSAATFLEAQRRDGDVGSGQRAA